MTTALRTIGPIEQDALFAVDGYTRATSRLRIKASPIEYDPADDFGQTIEAAKLGNTFTATIIGQWETRTENVAYDGGELAGGKTVTLRIDSINFQ